MMYSLEIRASVEEVFKKLGKKDSIKLRIIEKKVKQIVQDPYRFKPLKKPMQHMRRVHIDGSFVMVYSVNESTKTVIIEDYDHHDNIYSV